MTRPWHRDPMRAVYLGLASLFCFQALAAAAVLSAWLPWLFLVVGALSLIASLTVTARALTTRRKEKKPMSHDHRPHTTFGASETVALTASLVGKAGARSFELAYDRADGPPLADDEEPADHDSIEWTATAEWPGGLTKVGRSICPPGEHDAGASLACAELLRTIGANVTVLDPR